MPRRFPWPRSTSSTSRCCLTSQRLIASKPLQNQSLLKKTKPNQNSLIRPNGHLLSHGKGKIHSKSQAVVDQQKLTYQHPLQHGPKNPRPFWERGDQHRWWVRVIQQLASNPHRASFHREPLGSGSTAAGHNPPPGPGLPRQAAPAAMGPLPAWLRS